jgi:hypothetical protein
VIFIVYEYVVIIFILNIYHFMLMLEHFSSDVGAEYRYSRMQFPLRAGLAAI